MQYHKKLNIVLAVQAALWLAACGGGGNAAAPVAATTPGNIGATAPVIVDGTAVSAPTIAVTGKVLNVGYLANTLVCADLDNDGACGSAEPQATSDALGAYSLAVPAGHQGSNLLAVVRPASKDSASTGASPIVIGHGWTLAAPLEYADGATAVSANISPITSTYYARLRSSGRNRLSTRIAMFTRIAYTTNIDPATSAEILPVDFDYVATPPPDDAAYGSLAGRMRQLSDYLSTPASHSTHPANASPAALDLLQTAGVMNGWYNTWSNASSSAAGMPADAAKIDALAGNSTPAAYIANVAKYYDLTSAAASETRNELVDTASIGGNTWLRDAAALKYINVGGLALSNGGVFQKYQQWMAGSWSPLTLSGAESLTLDGKGQLALVGATDDQQARTITYSDGNRLTYRLPVSLARQSLNTSARPADNDVINEWFGQQGLSYATYYSRAANTTAAAGPGAAPACYTGSSSSVSAWFSACVTSLRNAYFAANGGGTTSASFIEGAATTARAEYYDVTLQDSRVDIPLAQVCGSGTDAGGAAISLPKASVLGKNLCNWAVDAQANHALAELFQADGVTIHSGTRYYGVSTYNASAAAPCAATGATSGSCTLPAPTSADQGLPVRLKLKLVRAGGESSGSGTLSSATGAWSTSSNTARTETIRWEISAANPRMVLISYPFRNAGDPRKNTSTTSSGAVVAGTEAAPVLSAHFATSIAPSTLAAPNYRKFAIVLQDGVFVTGYQYGAGYTEAERHLNKRAMELGIGALGDVLAKLYAAGFK